MSEYSMPVLSEQERQELIEQTEECITNLSRWVRSFSGDRDAKRDLKIYQIALAALTAKPVAFTAQSNLAGFGGSVGYMWPPGNEKTSDVALYAKPTVPVKQEGEQRD